MNTKKELILYINEASKEIWMLDRSTNYPNNQNLKRLIKDVLGNERRLTDYHEILKPLKL